MLLDRLRSERRWAVALFIVAAAVIAAIQLVFAPAAEMSESTRGASIAEEIPQ